MGAQTEFDFLADLESSQTPQPSNVIQFPQNQDTYDFLSDLEQPQATPLVQNQQQSMNETPDFLADIEPQKERQLNLPFVPKSEKPKPATGTEKKQSKLLESFSQGLQESASGEIAQQFFDPATQQEIVQDPTFWESLVKESGTITGDLPYMAAGATLGAAIGSPGGPIGATVGGAFGAMAVPAFLKESLKQYREYQQSGKEDLTFGEFLQKADKVANRTLNEGLFGVILGTTAKAIPMLKELPGIGSLFNSKVAQTTSKVVAEAGVATAVPAAVEGRLPEAKDFAHALALFGGFSLAHLPLNALEVIGRQGKASGLSPEEFAKTYDPEKLARIQKVVDERIALSAKPAKESATFTTEKGSVYAMNPDGTTTRNKAARPEHPGDQGVKPKSEKTFFVTQEQANQLSEVKTTGEAKRIFQYPDGRVGVQTIEGPNTGKVEARTVIEPQTKPGVGLLPVELWQDGKEVHFGSKITEVKTPGATGTELPKGAMLTKLEHIVIGSEGGKAHATVPVEQEGGGYRHQKIELTTQERQLIEGAASWEKSGDKAEASRMQTEARQMIYDRLKGKKAPEAKAPVAQLPEVPKGIILNKPIHVSVGVKDGKLGAMVPIRQENGRVTPQEVELTKGERQLLAAAEKWKGVDKAEAARLEKDAQEQIFYRLTGKQPAKMEIRASKVEPHPALKDIPQDIFRGSGRESKEAVYGEVAEPILGEGRYYAFTEDAAKQYGPKVEAKKLDLKNPLVIRNDAEWRAFTKKAGLDFPNPIAGSKAETEANVRKLHDAMKASGHDGAVIYWEPESKYADVNKQGESIKTLSKVFDTPQVFELRTEKAAKPTVQMVKNQHGKEVEIPKKFFHATHREIKGELKPDLRGTVHFADSRNDVLEANRIARPGEEPTGKVIEKDLDLNKVFVNREKQKREYSKAHIDQLKKAGYDGIYFPEHGIFEYFTKEPIDVEHIKQVRKERLLQNADSFKWKNPADKAEYIRKVNAGDFSETSANKWLQGKVISKYPAAREITAGGKALPVSPRATETPHEQKKSGPSVITPAMKRNLAQPPENPTEALEKAEARKASTREGKTLDEAVSFESPPPEKTEGMGFRQAIVDELHPLQKYVAENKATEEIPFSKDPYKMARLFKGHQGKAQVFLEHKTFDPETLDWTGKGLREILKPHKKDLQGLSKYLVARRAIELSKQGKETGVDLTDANAYVKENHKKYEAARKELRDYQNSLLDYAEDSGLISAETKEHWKGLNEDYVPFQRVFSPEGKEYMGKSMQPKQQFFKLEGSKRNIIDPLESIIGNTYKIIEASEKNRVIRSLVEFEKIKKGAADANSFIEVHEVGSEEPTLKSFSDYLQGKDVVEGNKVKYFDNGKLKTIEVNQEVADVLKGNFGPREMTYLGNLLQYPVRWIRTGAVALNPEKLIKLAVQDQFEAYVYSEVGYKPFYDLVRGIFNSVKKNDLYNKWRASGGDQSLQLDMSRARKQENLQRIAGAKNVVKSADDVMRLVEETFKPLETGTRVSLFERALERNGESPEALREAALLARETTLDYAKKGAKTKTLVQTIPFFNAAVQGIDKGIQEFKRNPKGVAIKGAAFLSVPTTMLWLWNNTNFKKDYEELPQWEKDAFWNFFVDVPGKEKPLHLKIPKPHELGFVFATTVEHVLDYIDKNDPKALKELGKAAYDNFTPPLLPAVIRTGFEQYSNKNLLTGRPLVPQRLEKLTPEEQVHPYTSETAKQVGKLIQHIPYIDDTKLASPIIIDHWISSLTGGAGRRLVDYTEKGLEKAGVLEEKVRPEKDLADYPLVGAFVGRRTGANSASVSRFYEESEKLEKQFNAIKKAAQENRQSEIKDKDIIVQKHKQAQKIRQAFAKIRTTVRNIAEDNDPTHYTPAEKRILIDQLEGDMVRVSRAFLGREG